MFAKLFGNKMPENVTINISSLTVHNHFNIGEELMSKFDELSAKIDTIATATDVSAVQAEIDEVKTALAENEAADEATKLTVDEHGQLIEKLVNKLAAAPAPTGEGDTGTGA